MDIKLTDAERLILANQYKILSYVDTNESDGWAQLSDQLRAGHAWLYEDQLGMMMSPVLPQADADFVIKVLGIYSDMRDSLGALDDKSGITEHNVYFPGFDGNDRDEVMLLSFTEALRRDGRFSQTIPAGRDLNSHCPTLRGYRRMVGQWEEMGRPRYPLDKGQIEALVLAKRT